MPSWASMPPYPPAAEVQVDEDAAYLSRQIITYIGNKRALLPFIGRGLARVCERVGRDRLDLVDLFSGSGVVARYLKAHARLLVANDLEAYSRITNLCYLRNLDPAREAELAQRIAAVRAEINAAPCAGFLAELYAPREDGRVRRGERCFYTRRNAVFLDTAVQVISRQPEAWQPLLLAPLIARASVHANTAGIFKAFYKNSRGVGQFGGRGRDALSRILAEIDLELPVCSRHSCETLVCQSDANELVRTLPPVDLAYIDPPYNQHPYGSNYFMLNLLADYRRPSALSRISGIPVDWNRSRYNRRVEAEAALEDLVGSVRARFVMLSYNSEGFIPPVRFQSLLERFGPVEVLETSYNAFRGSRNLKGRALHVTEFLFLLEKR